MTSAEHDNPQRTIKSFVLRQGHLSNGQARAIEELMPKWGIPYQNGLLNLEQQFESTAPKVLEIGFGMGTATVQIAQSMPQTDFLGIEVHSPGVGNILKLIEEQHISNLRIIQHDAVEVIQDMIADAALAGIHIYFPDPWHKKRHHKRRLIQLPFIQMLVPKLKLGGYLHLATDWENYAEQMLEVLSQHPQLHNCAKQYASKPEYRPLTKFEARGIKLGHGVWDIIFQKI